MKKLLTRYIFDLIISTFFSRHYKNARAFYQDRPALALITHWVEGFGMALLLQHYFQGTSFLPPAVGWILVCIPIGLHVIALIKK